VGPGLDRDGTSGMASFTRWIEQNIPYLVLLAIVFIYEHWTGILAFAWLTSGLHVANTRMREQIALKEKRVTGVLLGVLCWLLATVTATLQLFESERLWVQFIFLTPSQPEPHRILLVVWRIVIADLLVRYVSMAAKVSLTLCLCSTPPRRLRQLFRLTEMTTAVYRSALPMPQWYSWLLAERSTHIFFSLVTGLYLTFKLAAVVDQLRAAVATCRSTMLHQPLYGRYASADDLTDDTTCSICHDDVSNPVILSCKHIFCEDCVCEWLERERTCPLCRAVVSSGQNYQSDGRTALMCQVF